MENKQICAATTMNKSILFIAALILCSCTSCTNQNNNDMTENPTVKTILNRKSVRKYTDQKVEKEKVDVLVRAAFAAPTGKNLRPWEIIVVDDEAILKSLGEQLHNAPMLKNAPLAIIIAGDTVKSPYWFLDCSAATENVLLAAAALDLGAVWAAAWPYDDRIAVVKSLIPMPAEVQPLVIIPIGYPLDRNKTPMDKYDENKLHYNKF
ncbi:MAG: nitroreductase family protein [Bacteroidales bacterium]|jgi:nitroreductase|nr:nitroreductase family protein [Bacteroidales bacterium]